MKLTLRPFIVSLLLMGSLPSMAQNVIDLPKLKDIPTLELTYESAEAYEIAFSNLSLEDKKAYQDHLFKASEHFGKKRVFEALEKLFAAEDILPSGPHAMNLFGACYVEFRDFEKAEKHFGTVYEMTPASQAVIFNLAEIAFVTKRWQTSLDRFDHLLLQFEGEHTQLTDLIDFKRMICLLKLGQKEEALKIKNSRPEDGDSPFYYYAEAVVQFEEGNDVEGTTNLINGRKVYGGGENPMNANWEDTMVEMGYIESFLAVFDAVEEAAGE